MSFTMSDLKTWRRQFAAEIVGESAEIVDALDTIRRVATTDCSILITGETGSGKELFARAAHRASNRRAKPFIPVNCAALPETLIEAELFGHVKGAFTGAMTARAGRFLSAQGGTLFLDEIGNLSLVGQMKLLRVLETGRFERLGSNKERHVKVRVISATNADLDAMIRAGTFREDLYYRLNTIELRVPPLVERLDDIVPLARHFLAAGKQLSSSACAALRKHTWPGNVRELKNVLQRAALLATGAELTVADLALPGVAPAADEIDRSTIEAALARASGVIAQAASDLGLSRQALYRRMEKLNIPKD